MKYVKKNRPTMSAGGRPPPSMLGPTRDHSPLYCLSRPSSPHSSWAQVGFPLPATALYVDIRASITLRPSTDESTSFGSGVVGPVTNICRDLTTGFVLRFLRDAIVQRVDKPCETLVWPRRNGYISFAAGIIANIHCPARLCSSPNGRFAIP